MDYLSSSDFARSDSGKVSDETEVIKEPYESKEPEFTETAHNFDIDKNTSLDQTSVTAGDVVSHQSKLDSIEVPDSPETGALEIQFTRDWRIQGEGSGRVSESRG